MNTKSISRWLTTWLVALLLAMPLLGRAPTRFTSVAEIPITLDCSGQGGSGGSCGGG